MRVTPNFVGDAQAKAGAAASAWRHSLNVIGATNARMEEVRGLLADSQAALDQILPANYRYLSPQDARYAYSAFVGQSDALRLFAIAGSANDYLLGALATAGNIEKGIVVSGAAPSTASTTDDLVLLSGSDKTLAAGVGKETFAAVGTGTYAITGFAASVGGDVAALAGTSTTVNLSDTATGLWLSSGGYALRLSGLSIGQFSVYENLVGFKEASFASNAAGVSIDLLASSPHYYDALLHVSDLTGSALSDTLRGDERANVLRGGAGDDGLF